MAPQRWGGGAKNGGGTAQAATTADNEVLHQVAMQAAAAAVSQLQRTHSRWGGGGGGAGGSGHAPLRSGAVGHSHGGDVDTGGGRVDRSRAPKWACLVCGTAKNFAERVTCFKCGVPKGQRASTAAGSAGGSKEGRPAAASGPQRITTADGWTDVAPPAGSNRTPAASPSPPGSLSSASGPTSRLAPSKAGPAQGGGAATGSATATSVSKRVVDASVRAPGPRGADGHGPMLAFPKKTAPQPPIVDAEGYTRVAPRRGRNVSALAEVFEPGPTVQESVQLAQAAAGAARVEGQPMASGNAGTGVEEISDDEHQEAEPGPTLDALRETWEAKQRLLRDAEGKFAADEPMLGTLRTYVEQAKAAYDAAKPRGSGSRKLQRAERVLDRAQKARDRTAGLINQLRVDFKDRLERLQDQLDEENAKVASAQEGVDEAIRGLNGGGQTEGEAAAQALCQGLLQSIMAVGPAMQSVAAALRTVAPEQAQLLSNTLLQLEQGYNQTSAALQRQTAFYNVADDDDEEDAEAEDMDQDGDVVDDTGPGPTAGNGPPACAAAAAASGAAGSTGQAAPRLGSGDDCQPPPSKKHCDGSAPMEDQEDSPEL